MKKLLSLLLISFLISHFLHAQSVQPYGVIDTADLRLNSCDFEKGANAMVLFDQAEVSTYLDSVVMYRHIRLKILNTSGKDRANIRLSYYAHDNYEKIPFLEAQTINLEKGHIVYDKVGADQVFTENIDKNRKALVFAFGKVIPGSIIEYRYKWKTNSPFNFPTWFFQSSVPTRYSQLTAITTNRTRYKVISKGGKPVVKDSVELKDDKKSTRTTIFSRSNIHTLSDEPFTTRGTANLQCLIFTLQTVQTEADDTFNVDKTWLGIALGIGSDPDFGVQLGFRLNKEDSLIRKAKELSTSEQKIVYLFNLVKTRMAWNNVDHYYTDQGIRQAWVKKIGNSTEINLILYHLLQKSGVNAHPMLVSTRDNGELNPLIPSYYSLNKTVVYVPVDSSKYYILDASSKYNVYNDMPLQQLNTWGLKLDREINYVTCKLVFLKNDQPAQQVVLINGDIGNDGQVTGNVEIDNYSYNREHFMRFYDKLGRDKYADTLRNKNDQLDIKDLKLENMETDSLPIVQKFGFILRHNADDEKYMYLDPNIFTPLHTNPFLKEERYAGIDFGNCNLYSINERYKLPSGYKIDALPKSLVVSLSDKSIVFKRVIGETNGYVELHYTINQKRSQYDVTEYGAIRDFYKKMYDMLNEPIVLKKAL